MKPLTADEVEEYYIQQNREINPPFYSLYLETLDVCGVRNGRRLYRGRIRYEWDDSGQSWHIEEVKRFKYGEVVTRLYQRQYGKWWRLWTDEPSYVDSKEALWEKEETDWGAG